MKLPKISLTWKIMIGLVVGIFVGWLVRKLDIEHPGEEFLGIDTQQLLAFIRSLSLLFLHLIKSIIAPMIFATLVIGIAGTGDMRQVGRIGVKSLVYFEIVTTLALVIGLVAVNLIKPGVGVNLEGAQATGLPTAEPKTLPEIIAHLSPTSIVDAMARGEVLQIVVFAVLFALACVSIGKTKAEPVVKLCESIADVMFRFTEFIMKFAPIGVGAAMAYAIGHNKEGLGVLENLGKLVLTLYGALLVFVLLVLIPIALMFRVPLRDFFNAVKEPASIAFATTSSESALPKAMENMVRLGVPRRIVGFVLPTGYSFNLDGTTLYLSLASVFVAQAAGIEMTLGQQILMLVTLMLTSKGVAGVPRASLVILLGTLASFQLPVEVVFLIMGVDELMDMARTMINVIGNCLATVVIAKWEKAFRNEEWEAEMKELNEVTGQSAIVTQS
jgi:proton glutamate symport protein